MSRYLPECLLLLLFTYSGIMLVDTYREKNDAYFQAQVMQQVQLGVTEVTVETHNASYAHTQHYDRHAQLLLALEQEELKLPRLHHLRHTLSEFKQTISSYMQLITMLKTSRRFILSIHQHQQQSNSGVLENQLLAMLLAFIEAPSSSQVSDIKGFMAQNENKIIDTVAPNHSWDMLQKHINFLLNNSITADQWLLILQRSDLSSKLIGLNQAANQQVLIMNQYWSLYAAALLCSLFGLILLALFRLALELQRKSKEALASSEIKTQFLANMSHEIRTPMNGIIGLTDLCLTTELDPTQNSYLQKIQFSARSLMTIINDILDFSKIESQKLDIEKIDFNTGELLDNLKMMLSKPASEKGIEFIFDISTQVPVMLNGDPIRIGQILLNITSNAIKFTRQGHVIVRVYMEDNEGEQWLHCQVEDTGIGLNKKQIGQLFKRFTQAQASTTRQFGGTGLGLAISRSLLELMGGKVEVTSQPDVGSTFHFCLPCPTTDGSPLITEPLPTFEHHSILIVEDHQLTAEVLKKLCHHLKLDVVTVNSPRQAIAQIKLKQFDFALVDWQLPDMIGLQLIKAMEQQPQRPLKIALCTGFNSDILKEQMEDDSNHPLLIKPVSLVDLADSLTAQSGVVVENQNTVTETSPMDSYQGIKDKHILLVEDNEINQLIAVNMLELEGVQVDIAENGQQALDKVQETKYDLVLMDIQMPVMDGLEATRNIRESFDKIQLPIIALTANVMNQEIQHYLTIGMNDHLGKPFEKEQLHKILDHYLPSIH